MIGNKKRPKNDIARLHTLLLKKDPGIKHSTMGIEIDRKGKNTISDTAILKLVQYGHDGKEVRSTTAKYPVIRMLQYLVNYFLEKDK